MFSSDPCLVGGFSTGSCSSVGTDADEVAIFVFAFFVGGSHGGSKERAELAAVVVCGADDQESRVATCSSVWNGESPSCGSFCESLDVERR